MKRSHILAIILAALSLQAAAAFDADHRVPPTEPHYWMKAYPNAEPAKVQKCLAEAQAVFYKQLKGNMDGVMTAVLWKGNAWEACMDGGK